VIDTEVRRNKQQTETLLLPERRVRARDPSTSFSFVDRPTTLLLTSTMSSVKRKRTTGGTHERIEPRAETGLTIHEHGTATANVQNPRPTVYTAELDTSIEGWEPPDSLSYALDEDGNLFEAEISGDITGSRAWRTEASIVPLPKRRSRTSVRPIRTSTNQSYAYPFFRGSLI